jgi:WD40 repeat protein
MNAMCRSCLCVVVVIGCGAAQAEENPSPKRSEYERWVKFYSASSTEGKPPRLVVTALEHDEPQANAQDLIYQRAIGYGCSVTADGGSYDFYWDPGGTKGGGPTTIPADDLKRLDKLLSKLPDDGARLPPPNRRIVLQVPAGDHFRVRVYDRANAPDVVWEIIRLSQPWTSMATIGSWVPKFSSERDVPVNAYSGMIAVPPNGVAIMDRSFKFRDPVTHKELNVLPSPGGRNPQGITFSPDGSLGAFGGGWQGAWVVDTKTWKEVRHFKEPTVGRYLGSLRFPQFTADGRLLLFLCSKPDSNGHGTTLPRVYDTKTWEKLDRIPAYPENTLTCIEAPKGKRAVILLKGSVAALWDCERHRRYAKLDEDVQIRQVAFSPDESMVAMATLHERDGQDWPESTSRGFHIRVWNMVTGDLVHELHPFETGVCETVVGLQWTADSQYILAATKTSSSEYDINLWNAKSGRHRGSLIDGLSPPWGVVIVSDGSRIAACGAVYTLDKDSQFRGSKVLRFWDLAAALKQIRAFEDSLAVPKAGK